MCVFYMRHQLANSEYLCIILIDKVIKATLELYLKILFKVALYPDNNHNFINYPVFATFIKDTLRGTVGGRNI